MNILVTGGAGYIGTHATIALLDKGHEVTVIDMLSNSSKTALERVEKISGKKVPFFEVDLTDISALKTVFTDNSFDAVMHLAGHKAVGESLEKPLLYYRNNLLSTLNLCEVMSEQGVKRLVFSSSATVYGAPTELPLREDSQVGVGLTNPYGQTKYMIERILQDVAQADPEWQIAILRYFNPIGAHESGLIGEDPAGIPNNITPFISQVAVGKIEKLRIFGDDYDTPDGTCIRDYIHVVDLAAGHLAAIEHLPTSGAEVYNLGTGRGVSVLELLHAYEKAVGKPIPHEIAPRRPGDIAACYADVSKAARDLHWKATKSLDKACQDAWNWQSHNPNGYK